MLDPARPHRAPGILAQASQRGAAPLLAAALGLGCAPDAGPLGAAGEPLFTAAIQVGGPGEDRALALARTTEGDAVVAGFYGGALEVGPLGAPAPPRSGLFVTRVGLDGAPAWLYALPIEGASLRQLRLEVDALDRPVIAATVLGGPLDLGTGPLPGEGLADLVVLRLGVDGVPERAARLGGAGAQVLNGLALGPRGDLLLGGRFDQLTLGLEAPVRAEGREDAFVTRLDPSLNPRWTRTFTAPAGLATTTALAARPDGRAVAAVRFERALRGADRDLVAPLAGVALIELAPDGRPLRSELLVDGGAQIELVDGAPGPDGAALFGGSARGPVSSARGELRTRGVDGLWVRWPAAGPLELGRVGGPGTDRVRALSADRAGRIWLAGSFEATLERIGRPLEGGPELDAFAARVDLDGRVRWAGALAATGPGASVYAAGVAAGALPTGWWLGGHTGAADAPPFTFPDRDDGEIQLLRLAPR